MGWPGRAHPIVAPFLAAVLLGSQVKLAANKVRRLTGYRQGTDCVRGCADTHSAPNGRAGTSSPRGIIREAPAARSGNDGRASSGCCMAACMDMGGAAMDWDGQWHDMAWTVRVMIGGAPAGRECVIHWKAVVKTGERCGLNIAH